MLLKCGNARPDPAICWSSFRHTAGLAAARQVRPDPIGATWLLGQFGSAERESQAAYRRFVRARGEASTWDSLRSGLVLGGNVFIATLPAPGAASEVPQRQRVLARPALVVMREGAAARGAWMTAAHDDHDYTLSEIAAEAGLHYATISMIIAARREGAKTRSLF